MSELSKSQAHPVCELFCSMFPRRQLSATSALSDLGVTSLELIEFLIQSEQVLAISLERLLVESTGPITLQNVMRAYDEEHTPD
ncbi:MAG TPA: hypothetical protein VKP30_14675 [Polyangiaceae bacterium]|nr:hypothetical protein [Polyangiaceae bacterium]